MFKCLGSTAVMAKILVHCKLYSIQDLLGKDKDVFKIGKLLLKRVKAGFKQNIALNCSRPNVSPLNLYDLNGAMNIIRMLSKGVALWSKAY